MIAFLDPKSQIGNKICLTPTLDGLHIQKHKKTPKNQKKTQNLLILLIIHCFLNKGT